MEPIDRHLTKVNKNLDFCNKAWQGLEFSFSPPQPPPPLQLCANSNHITLERNIQTLPQRCPINDLVVQAFFVGSLPNKGIMSILPQGQSQWLCVVI